MFDPMFFKNFLARYGLILAFGYMASFILLVLSARKGLIVQGLPGDILTRNEDKITLFLPFFSSAVMMVVFLMAFQLFMTFRISKFFKKL